MATAAEVTFNGAWMIAEGVRQVAKAAAFATFQAAGFTPAAYATYAAALTTADVAYVTALNTAATTLSLAGYTIPNAGGTNPGNVGPAGFGVSCISTMNLMGDGNATMGAIA